MSASPITKDADVVEQPPSPEDPDAPMDPQDPHAGMGYEFEVKEQDRWLPIANGQFLYYLPYDLRMGCDILRICGCSLMVSLPPPLRVAHSHVLRIDQSLSLGCKRWVISCATNITCPLTALRLSKTLVPPRPI